MYEGRAGAHVCRLYMTLCARNNTLSRVLLLVDRFDTSNPYEAMHCYLNAFLVLAMLRITHENVQVQ